MAPKQPNTGLFVGLNKAHIVTKKELAPRPSDRKGLLSISLAASAILRLSSPMPDFFATKKSTYFYTFSLGLLRDEGVLLKHKCENEEAEEHANWSSSTELATIFTFLGLPTVKIELGRKRRAPGRSAG
ncbi:hypothetical protein NL676_031998 [Syzygium grande]|nr:hypothetical protein NL676_031998 [Syzygium grande]